MHIRYGYRIELNCNQATPAILMLDVHPSRRADIVRPDRFSATRLAEGAFGAPLPVHVYEDPFGNLCRRLVLPPGGVRLEAEGLLADPGTPEPVLPELEEWPVESLPDAALTYLLGSRYCETDRLTQTAWSLFGSLRPGWTRVQAVVDFVHNHLTFGYQFARNTRTAAESFEERVGVCRDFAHLAVALCRCLNIPARYCTGYLGDIGVPRDPAPMDFSAWFEVFLGGGWHAFDARHNRPRIGRIPIARGRDATDVPIIHSFGPHWLQRFEVITEEAAPPASGRPAPQQEAMAPLCETVGGYA